MLLSVGTGGTVSGISHTLKKNNPAVQSLCRLRPMKIWSAFCENLDHIKSKVSAGFIPNTLDTMHMMVFRHVSSRKLSNLRAMGGAEGFLVGISSAAAIFAAIEVAKELGSGKRKFLLLHQIMENVIFLHHLYNLNNSLYQKTSIGFILLSGFPFFLVC